MTQIRCEVRRARRLGAVVVRRATLRAARSRYGAWSELRHPPSRSGVDLQVQRGPTAVPHRSALNVIRNRATGRSSRAQSDGMRDGPADVMAARRVARRAARRALLPYAGALHQRRAPAWCRHLNKVMAIACGLGQRGPRRDSGPVPPHRSRGTVHQAERQHRKEQQQTARRIADENGNDALSVSAIGTSRALLLRRRRSNPPAGR